MKADVRSALQAAFVADNEGRFEAAEHLYARVLAVDPKQYEALLYQAILAVKRGDQVVAVRRLRHVIEVYPGSVGAMNFLSMCLRELGRNEEAIQVSERATSLAPQDADAAYNLGLCRHVQGAFAKAIDCFERGIELNPSQAAYFYALASSYEAIGGEWPAILAMRKSSTLDPIPESLIKLGRLALSVGRQPEALECAERALLTNPGLVEGYLLQSDSLLESGDWGSSDQNLQKALTIDPTLRISHTVDRAKRLRWLGRFSEANTLFEECIRSSPLESAPYLGLVSSKKITDDDRPLLSSIEAVISDPNTVPRKVPALHYALGKAFDDLGEYENAMRHYDLANVLALRYREGVPPFDRRKFEAKIDSVISMFTKDMLLQQRALGSKSDVPIFVLGMMRSGTTLTEQILSSHPLVAAGGEQGHWTFNEHKILDLRSKVLHRAMLRARTTSYLELLGAIGQQSPHVTDKNPANCMVAGLLAIAFPRAPILHMMRDPIDTCLSIWITPVRMPADFACVRENIVFAYRHYLRLMEHWRSVLPETQFRTFQYEDLVTDRDRATREMVAFCRLPWEDSCLRPEQNVGKVSTPSFWQVRQPINTRAVGRWKRYEPWLGAFLELRSTL